MSESDEEYLEDISDGEAQALAAYGTRSSEWNDMKTKIGRA